MLRRFGGSRRFHRAAVCCCCDSQSHRSYRVDDVDARRRLDAFLTDRLARGGDAAAADAGDVSRARIAESIRGGTAAVNGGVEVKPSRKVRAGDVVSFRLLERPPLRVAPEAIPLSIVYEDDVLLVVDKPAGMVTHPAPGNYEGTLASAVLAHTNGDDAFREGGDGEGGIRPGIVHRLDKGTSGLIVVAKDARAERALQRQFAQRTIERRYASLAIGTPAAAEGVSREVTTALARDPRHRTRMAAFPVAHAGTPPYRLASSRLTVEEDLDGAGLVTWRLKTGRTHQIRVHAAHMGAPLVQDGVYGGSIGRLRASIGPERAAAVAAAIDRPALHAETLGFIHPVTQELMRFQVTPPPDFTNALNALRR